MDSSLAPRLLALPADIRATLARVPGMGTLHSDKQPWPIKSTPHASYAVVRRAADDIESRGGMTAWFPANPTAAVAAVLGCSLADAHAALAVEHHRVFRASTAHGERTAEDDHAAALTIIEAHAASRSPHAR